MIYNHDISYLFPEQPDLPPDDGDWEEAPTWWNEDSDSYKALKRLMGKLNPESGPIWTDFEDDLDPDIPSILLENGWEISFDDYQYRITFKGWFNGYDLSESPTFSYSGVIKLVNAYYFIF